MKLLLLIIPLIIIVLLGIAWYVLSDPTPAAYLHTEGTVEVDLGRGWTPATNGMSLKQGTRIRTIDGTASVILHESVIASLDTNSQLTLDSTSKKALKITHTTGKLWNKFTDLAGIPSYSVTTPKTVATVRGTEYGTDLTKEDILHLAAEGHVDISTEEEELELAALEKIVYDTQLTKQPLTPEDARYILKNLKKTLEQLKKIRWNHISRQQFILSQVRRQYNLDDTSIRAGLDKIDAGAIDYESYIDKLPYKPKAALKFIRITKTIQEQLKLIKQVETYAATQE